MKIEIPYRYCTNMLTVALNDNLEKFIQEITRLQKRFHEKNPNKSKYKRRYYSGLKEVRKHVELKKLKFVIIAPDIEKVELEGKYQIFLSNEKKMTIV